MDTRREAIFLLTRWLETRAFPDRMLAGSQDDRAFVMDLVYTTIRRYRALEWILGRLTRLPQGETRAALLIGAAQLLYMQDVADYAAVNETVAAAKRASRVSGGFVNAVLRNLIRRRDELLAALAQEQPPVRLSHPTSLYRRWAKRYGEAGAEALCEWNNRPAETFLAFPPGAETPFAVLPRGERVDRQPGYAEGAFIVQDPAPAVAVALLDARPGQRVLDACAAPGGKTVQLAWRMRGEGELVACDLYENRLETVRRNLARTRQGWVTTAAADFSRPDGHSLTGTFDRILLDAPCSNTGVLRRRVDARWRWNKERMAACRASQAALLDTLSGLLAPGGTLVYSTCSLEPEENGDQVAAFLKRHPDFTLRETAERLPFRDKTDGAFAAALTK